MPITRKVTFLETAVHIHQKYYRMAILSKITVKPDFLYWPPVRYLLLPLVPNSALVQKPKWPLCHNFGQLTAIIQKKLLNVTEMLFDECEIPWNVSITF